VLWEHTDVRESPRQFHRAGVEAVVDDESGTRDQLPVADTDALA
jgi:hypothetical protein